MIEFINTDVATWLLVKYWVSIKIQCFFSKFSIEKKENIMCNNIDFFLENNRPFKNILWKCLNIKLWRNMFSLVLAMRWVTLSSSFRCQSMENLSQNFSIRTYAIEPKMLSCIIHHVWQIWYLNNPIDNS